VFVAAVSLLAVLLTSFDLKDMSVDAASLKHIDEIVASSGTFNILEIVPDAAGASVGYYIDGQEPIKYWKEALAALLSPADRSNHINTLFSRLADKGVLGAEDVTATPLQRTYYDSTNSSYYTETYEVTDETGWSILPLDQAESTTKTGTFTLTEDGPYAVNYAYTEAAGGGYVQNILYFSYTDAPVTDGSAYYYAPVFTLLTDDMDLNAMGGYAVYTKDENNIYHVNPARVTVADIVAAGGFDISQEYFYVDPAGTGAPGAHNYRPSSAWATRTTRPATVSRNPWPPTYFTREITSFTYVGAGGNYANSDEGARLDGQLRPRLLQGRI
jgi:hypothetical protein